MRRPTDEMVDPVTGFVIPPAWLEKSGDPRVVEKVKSGRWVLLSDGTLLRRGYTTGTTAAAACKGAVISLVRSVEEVKVLTPVGIRVALPVKSQGGVCIAIKDAGDHEFDVTSGMKIEAKARPSEKTELIAGSGIGQITRGGLCDTPGKPAISRSARREIMRAIEEGLDEAGMAAARVVLKVPRGEEIAPQTLNAKVGVIGGISILGSTGFVEPWNEHLSENRVAEIRDMEKVVITTGRVGLKYSRVLFPHHQAVLVGSRLDELSFREEQDSVICGLPALILKWGMPEILEGTGYRTVAEMVEHRPDHPRIDLSLKKVRERLPHTRIVLLKRDGRILREDGP